MLQKGIIYDDRYLLEGYNIVERKLRVISTERHDSYKAIRNSNEEKLASSAASFVDANIRKMNL